MGKFKDITGITFHRLTVIKRAENLKSKNLRWLCQCSCGKTVVVYGCDLKSGHTKSCGCLKAELLTKYSRKNPRKGKAHYLFGRTLPKETKEKIRQSRLGQFMGENNPHWNPNLTSKEREDGRTFEGYSAWRTAVYERDNYVCQACGDSRGGNLIAHHIEGYNNNPSLRVKVSNGITLCEDCHNNFHHQFGRGNNTAEQFKSFMKAYNYNKRRKI